MKKLFLFFAMSFFSLNLSATSLYLLERAALVGHRKLQRPQTIPHKVGYFFGDIVQDAFLLHRYLFTVDSAKLLTAFSPFYIMARQFDESLQSRFYDPVNHKNVSQVPDWCRWLGKNSVGFPIIFLSGLSYFGWNEDLRMTGRIYLIGLPLVQSGKDSIKKIDVKACLRPWNERFSSIKRGTGGFPSGHMANIGYAATLFAMRHGPRWGVPLGLLGGFMAATLVNTNRHYLSQIIAGVALGSMYAFAADKVVEQRMTEHLHFDMDTQADGKTYCRVSMNF